VHSDHEDGKKEGDFGFVYHIYPDNIDKSPNRNWFLPGGEIKKPLPSACHLDKGLVDRLTAPAPGLSTVLTESGSAFSLTDNYSPLDGLKYNFSSLSCQVKNQKPFYPFHLT
jgi:hypothetical protein